MLIISLSDCGGQPADHFTDHLRTFSSAAPSLPPLKQALARIEQNAFDLAACHEAANAAISQVQGLPVYDYVAINDDGSGVARIRSWFPNSEISASNLKHDGRRQAFRFLCLEMHSDGGSRDRVSALRR